MAQPLSDEVGLTSAKVREVRIWQALLQSPERLSVSDEVEAQWVQLPSCRPRMFSDKCVDLIGRYIPGVILSTIRSTDKVTSEGESVRADGAPYILVAGSGQETCTARAKRVALELGRELGKRRCIVVTGGLGGVMETVCQGVKEEGGGPTLCILPGETRGSANPYCDIAVATGPGHGRNLVNSNTADAVIVVGGGAGTLSEACFASLAGKPVVALPASGGVAEEIAGRRLDSRRTSPVKAAGSPKEAVDIVFRELEHEGHEGKKRSENHC